MNQAHRRLIPIRNLATPFLPLLRRAVGLHLLDHHEQYDQIVIDLEPLERHGPDDVPQGILYDEEQDKLVKRVLRTEKVNFPEPGWSGESRERWDDILWCLDRCAFPQACACR